MSHLVKNFNSVSEEKEQSFWGRGWQLEKIELVCTLNIATFATLIT